MKIHSKKLEQNGLILASSFGPQRGPLNTGLIYMYSKYGKKFLGPKLVSTK